jgi:long-chain fatty acid transport protein
MKRRTTRGPGILALAGLSMLLALQPVHAGGLYVSEFGQPSMGASSAGTGVLAEDASTAATNPAGIMQLDDGQWMLAVLGIFSSIEFEQKPGTTVTAAGSAVPGSGSNGGDAGSTAVGLSVAFAKPVSDKWGFGFAFNSISSAALDYEQPADFVGRYWGQEVELLTITAIGSVAYRVSDSFTIAFGVPVLFGSLNMDVSTPGPVPGAPDGLAEVSDGEDISATVQLSGLWDINDRTRFGFLYVAENEVDFDSDLEVTLPTGVTMSDLEASVKIPFAQTLRLHASRDVSDKATLLASVAWEDWSAFDNLLITTPIAGVPLARNWDDTYRFALGARLRAGDRWTWYTGAAYDTDPSSDSDRTADMAIDRQIRLSGGATWAKSEKVTLGGAVTYLDMGDGKIDNGGVRPVSGAPWTVVGEYETNRVIFVGFNVNWK